MYETNFFLSPQRCALLVVDIQERLMAVIHEKERVAKNAALLVRMAQTLAMPILVTTQYREKIGPVVSEVASALGEVPADDKMEFNCFSNAGFRRRVKALPPEIDTMIVCGIETHICIYQTMYGGLVDGYAMWIAADAVSSRTEMNYQLGLERIKKIGGLVGSTEMIIYELLQKAGTPEFKALLPFLK